MRTTFMRFKQNKKDCFIIELKCPNENVTHIHNDFRCIE